MKKFLLNTESYVLNLLTEKLNKDYLFHNVSKTQQVVNSIKELIEGEKISEVDANILLFAAWFHNIGFVNRKENYLEASVNFAITFLEEYNIDDAIIEDVVRLIRVTETKASAKDVLEKIMKDAVSFYYAENSFIDKNELLKQEVKLLYNTNSSELEWVQKNINILVKEHRFYTNYAQENWQNGKDKNLAKLVKTEKKLLNEKTTENNFESSFQTHNTLTVKATIILAVNGLILFVSLVGYYIMNTTTKNQEVLIPILIFLLFNVISAVLALVVALPLKVKQELNQDVLSQKINSKSRILKYTYIVFLAGIIVSVILFIIKAINA